MNNKQNKEVQILRADLLREKRRKIMDTAIDLEIEIKLLEQVKPDIIVAIRKTKNDKGEIVETQITAQQLLKESKDNYAGHAVRLETIETLK
jgi:hypothetical protein